MVGEFAQSGRYRGAGEALLTGPEINFCFASERLMPPIVKDSDVIAATPGIATANPPATSTLPETSPSRPQPVALEVPVTVNGARTVEGSEKREPFSETTKTVLVLSHGAVIRLAATVAPGQLLFLTNEKTKKEVVCQVVKSKNYRNVSGYVELEFTEPVVGFWGMRFPNDRIALASVAPAPVATISTIPPRPAAPKAGIPAASVTSEAVKAPPVLPKPVEPPIAKVKPLELKPVEVSVRPPEAPAPAAPLVAKPEIPAILVPVAPPAPVLNLPRASDAKPAAAELSGIQAQATAPKNPEPAAGSTEALKLETARLQEQLSSLLFFGAPAAKTLHELPANLLADNKSVSDVNSKIFNLAHNEPAPLKEAPPVKNVLPAPMPSLDEENLKIPAWLEPLARNTIAPASTQELIEREKSRRAAEKPELPEPVIAPIAVVDVDNVPEVRIPTFSGELLFDEKTTSENKVFSSSNKGVLIGAVAAGLILLVGGGAWYLQQQGGSLKSSVTSVAAPATTVAANVLQPQPRPAPLPQTAPVNNLGAVPPVAAASSSLVNSQIATPHDASTLAVTTSAPVVAKSTQPIPVQQQPHVVQQQPQVPQQLEMSAVQQKKPVLGEVHLASPKINRGASSQDSGAAEPGLALNGQPIASASDSLGGELVSGSVKQPTAPPEPPQVGGDVKPAKMISSVPPVYSSLARSQHVSGDVKIDALIDANGRVTSMKVISGPTLLHQAATDALRQWKYQPATLDGNPVPMHLMVTLQFRLQ
jgi:protein TonB